MDKKHGGEKNEYGVETMNIKMNRERTYGSPPARPGAGARLYPTENNNENN